MDWIAPAAFCAATFAIVALACFGRAGSRLDAMERSVAAMREDISHFRIQNPHAHMLGRVVEARKYEAYDWEPCMVVSVGWHGSLGLRKLSELDRRGFWIKHDLVPTHVREMGAEE